MSGGARLTTRTDWPQDRVDRLVELVATKRSAQQIAALMGDGLTRCAIIGKVQRLGLSLDGARKRRPRSAIDSRVMPVRLARAAAIAGPPKIKPARLPAPPPVPPTCNPVTIVARQPYQCRYILGEPAGPETRMCGAQTVHHSLCAYHLTLCWIPPPKRKSAA